LSADLVVSAVTNEGGFPNPSRHADEIARLPGVRAVETVRCSE
jgi:hypothetical protein